MRRSRARASRRAFSLVEMLIALAICSLLLSGLLAALDASFRSYKLGTESVSTHVVSRVVVQRVLAMIRTGSDFGPYPADVLDPDQNPVVTDRLEFVSDPDRRAENGRVTRLERRVPQEGQPGELWYVLLDSAGTTVEQRPLLSGVRNLTFTMFFDPGPRLRRATLDLTLAPDDYRDIRTGGANATPLIRLVASAGPRAED
ncbi:MAG: prepilin-type N-terminal cleavage/methylation domain-containing protein [Phycisphaerae bacterium]|nr:prepilin-type N-terminal cleavage/methylation domain-containing protein [Phycisphaerae bacterium]